MSNNNGFLLGINLDWLKRYIILWYMKWLCDVSLVQKLMVLEGPKCFGMVCLSSFSVYASHKLYIFGQSLSNNNSNPFLKNCM